MSEEDIIRGCIKHDRVSQHELYELYFPEMMAVSIRYAKNPDEAKAMLLDGFKNIFDGFPRFGEEAARRKKAGESAGLGEWIKKEFVACAVRFMYTHRKEHFVSSTVSVRDSEKPASSEIPDDQIIKSMTRQMLISALRQLSSPHRSVYNLHEVDGYAHGEISKLLDISEYSSKDSLSKAKFNLRKNLARMVPQKAL